MQSPPVPASFPSSTSPRTASTDHDDAFNLDAWASSSKDIDEIAPVPARAQDLRAGVELPMRSSNTPDAQDRPSWAALKTKAGKDRKRLPLACIACRRKKIKCSGEKPTCQHCVKARTPCVYKVTQRKAAPRTDYMAMLDKRLKRMEDRVIRIVPKETAEAIPRAVVKPSNQQLAALDSDASRKRQARNAFGEPELDLDGWAADDRPRSPSQLPRTAFFNKLEHGTAVEGADALPSMEIQEHLADVYFDYIYGQSYFLLHKPRYLLNLKAGNIPPYLSLAVCAVSARFSNHPELQTQPPFLRGENWAKAAQVVAIRYFDTPNIITVIVFALLSLHGFGACQGGRAFMLSGMAHRMSYSLRLHRDPDHDGLGGEQGIKLDFVDREMRRRTMWAIFQMDRFTASGLEKPLFAREGYLEVLPLPVNEMLYTMEIDAPTETLDGTPIQLKPGEKSNFSKKNSRNMGTAAYVARSIALWGRILEDLSIGHKSVDDAPGPWPSKSSWQRLTADLHKFHDSLPDSFKYSGENLRIHAQTGTAGAYLLMHLVFNHCLVFLHRFAFPGQPTGRPGPQHVLENARRTAFEAANRVTEIVSQSVEHRLTFPFGGYVAYVSSAVHLHGAFFEGPAQQKQSKQNLTLNIKYLSRMKKYWGMYHIMTENLKDLYRQFADASRKGVPAQIGVAASKGGLSQYSDWHEKYPSGVSMDDYEEILAYKPSSKDAALAEKSDVQTVETWVANRSPFDPTEGTGRAAGPQKKRARGAKQAQSSKGATANGKTGSASGSVKQELEQGSNVQAAANPSPEGYTTASSNAAAHRPQDMSGTVNDAFIPGGSAPMNVAFSNPGVSMDPNNQMWPSAWTNLESDFMFASEPFSDWNTILNMDLPGMDHVAADAAMADGMSADAAWFGDAMPGSGMPNMTSGFGNGQGGGPG